MDIVKYDTNENNPVKYIGNFDFSSKNSLFNCIFHTSSELHALDYVKSIHIATIYMLLHRDCQHIEQKKVN